MNIYEWEMAIYKSYRAAQLVDDPFDLAMSLVTIRALVISVIDYGHYGVGRPDRMIFFTDRNS